MLRLATDGRRAADGGFQYVGNDCLPRILNQDIATVQALSDSGVDVAPQVTLALNEADGCLREAEGRTSWAIRIRRASKRLSAMARGP